MPVFADTLYFVAMLNVEDDYHKSAMQWSRESRDAMVTTSWVLVEVGDAMAAPSYRPVFAKLIRNLRADTRATILGPDSDLFDSGLDLFSRRPDKWWSLTDCISFAAMEDQGIRDALTADQHFVQAGFHTLLRKNAS